MNLSMIAGPLIGAVIGYFTNYLAVRMLFRPRKEVRLMGVRLPFTPGVIPKGKSRMAKAVGNAVAEKLITKEDMKRSLLSDDMRDAVNARTTEFIGKTVREEIRDITGADEQAIDEKKVLLCDTVSRQIYESVMDMPVKEKAVEAMQTIAGAKIEELKGDSMIGGMIAMFLPEEKISALIENIGCEIEGYVAEHGMEVIKPAVERKADELSGITGSDLLTAAGAGSDSLTVYVDKIYCRIVDEKIGQLLERIDIAALVEEKIEQMHVEDLEELVMSVMKKELDTVVRLGALIGAVIGMLNIFI